MSEKIFVPGYIDTEFTIHDATAFDVKRSQDTTPIIDANLAFQRSGFDGYTPSRDLRHVARIPLVLMEQWAKEAGVSPVGKAMNEIVRKKLNDPDYSYLRTGGGRV